MNRQEEILCMKMEAVRDFVTMLSGLFETEADRQQETTMKVIQILMDDLYEQTMEACCKTEAAEGGKP